jgi:hypothetical protein
MSWKYAIALATMGALSTYAAAAQTTDPHSESIIHDVARHAGLAAAQPDMPDFVRESRPAESGDYIPVFQTPNEPTSTLKTKADLQKMNDDLDKIDKRHDQLRSAFPPSAQAMADKKAADLAKKAGKKPKPQPSTAAN